MAKKGSSNDHHGTHHACRHPVPFKEERDHTEGAGRQVRVRGDVHV